MLSHHSQVQLESLVLLAKFLTWSNGRDINDKATRRRRLKRTISSLLYIQMRYTTAVIRVDTLTILSRTSRLHAMSRLYENQASLNSIDSYQLPLYQLDASSLDDYNSCETTPAARSAQSPTQPPSSAPGNVLANSGQATGINGQVTQNKQKTTTWQMHWRAPTLILGLLAIGIALALGHHFYYRSLNGTAVSSDTRQEWALRFGTAFAFLTQSSLVASAGVAYTQRVWVTVKKKASPLRTLDNVFSLQNTLWSFFSWEVLAKAKALYLLGICIWYVHMRSCF